MGEVISSDQWGPHQNGPTDSFGPKSIDRPAILDVLNILDCNFGRFACNFGRFDTNLGCFEHFGSQFWTFWHVFGHFRAILGLKRGKITPYGGILRPL